MAMSKKRVAWLSVASNSLLTIGKLVAGLATGSVSVMSEAAHSAVDLLAAGIATFSVHVAEREPDQDHPYGHEKIENVSGVIEGLLILAAAAWIIYESVGKLAHGVELTHVGPGAAVMALSAGVNIVVATLLKRTAIQTRSVALEADAAHLYTDVYTSVGVFVGLVTIWVGERFLGVKLAWLDPVIAIGVALLILSTAYRITRKSFLPLMDVAASPEDMAVINNIMDEFRDQGVDFHKLRTRLAGPTLHVDLHMGCGPGATLERGHEISHLLKEKIEQSLPGAKVLVHVEPSREVEVLADADEQVLCMKEELAKDERVCEVRGFSAARYRGELRVEVDLLVEPRVTVSESHVLSHALESRMRACFPDIKELVLGMHPGDGWRDAIHDDDMALIKKLVGEHESLFAGIHELKVASVGERHKVHIRLAVPRLLPMAEAHAIAKHMEQDITELFPDHAEIDVHLEPCQQTCEACAANCPERGKD